MSKKAIVWFRNDLRLADNAALNYAAKNSYQVIFLYVIDNTIQVGEAAKWFLRQALSALQIDLQRKYKANLILKLGAPQEVIEELVIEHAVDCILWNRVYEPLVIQRDTRIKKYFKKMQLEVNSFNSSLLFEPEHIKNKSNSYFKVFTPFWKKCLTKIDELDAPYVPPASLKIVEHSYSLDSFERNLDRICDNPTWTKTWSGLYSVNEETAHCKADEFIENRVHNYHDARDFPAENGTSCLSAYLHFGLISPKQIYFKSLTQPESQGSECYMSEIGWREFAYYLLYYFPDLVNKNFKDKFDNFHWENNPEEIARWQEGITGIPIVDAGMRQLWQTGWMHNRVRMIVASFLIKNLLVDWRIGERWFWGCLLDADLAINSASWQWVAGSGADAAPYFRIFNPITQSMKFDPTGNYIRSWVPEIADLDNKEIHYPPARKNYPAAMVDLKLSRARALSVYKTAMLTK